MVLVRVPTVRWVVARSVPVIWRDVPDDGVGVETFDFCRVVPDTVFVAPRRVAARAVSSASVARAPEKPVSTSNTAKSNLNPFIPIWVC